jgi:cytoskeletal protein CcmA (bactofilin family)
MSLFKRESPDEILSLLGEGMEMVGEISFAKGLRVDGVVKGKVRSEGSLVIGAKGRVEAEIFIQRITINGEFHGIIRAADRIEIHKDGRVYGELYTPCLIIEPGAFFEGKCNMTEKNPPNAAEGDPPKSVQAKSGNPETQEAETAENTGQREARF